MQSFLRITSRSAKLTGKRWMSSGSEAHDHAGSMERWRNITFVCTAGCAALGAYTFQHEHKHEEKPPPYPYLRIRNKDFPWGNCGLLEKDCPSAS